MHTEFTFTVQDLLRRSGIPNFLRSSLGFQHPERHPHAIASNPATMVLTLEKVETTIRQACKSPSPHASFSDTSGQSGYHSLQDEQQDPANPDPVGGVYQERGRSRTPNLTPLGSMHHNDVSPDGSIMHSCRSLIKSESVGSMGSIAMVEKFSNIPWHVSCPQVPESCPNRRVIFSRCWAPSSEC